MKKLYSPLVCRAIYPAVALIAVLLIAGESEAQLVLTQSNFNEQHFYKHEGASVSNVTLPPEGNNQFWDYSSLVFDAQSTGNSKKYGFPVSVNLFPYASEKFRNDFFIAGGTVDIVSHILEGVSPAGYYAYAGTYKRQAFPLEGLSGVASDSFIVPRMRVILNHLNVALPAGYHNKWTSSGRIVYPYQLSLSAFGLDHTPGEYVVNYIQSDSVTGWGKARIPAGFGSPGVIEDVLMIKRNYYQVDSLYLNGSPAPVPLLAAFGFVQGGIYPEYSYRFYRGGTNSQYLTFITDPSYSTIASISYETQNVVPDCDAISIVMCRNGKMRCFSYLEILQALLKGWHFGPCTGGSLRETALSETDEPDKQGSHQNIFSSRIAPNPSPDKFILRINAHHSSPVTVTVYDVTGREINHFENINAELEFGHDLKAGIYFVHLRQNSGEQIIKAVKWQAL